MDQANGRGAGMSTPTLAQSAELIFREARLLDERKFEEWIDLYVEDAIYWIPAWRDDSTQTQDPDKELSLIYYHGRESLRDRVDRLKSGLSPASRVHPRVAHLISNVEIERNVQGEAIVHSTFAVHAYDPRTDRTSCHFGHYLHRFRRTDEGWQIASKIVRLANDLIPTVLDVNTI
jgi:benzoate/toluate 1,2-dioxygenase subunit beta